MALVVGELVGYIRLEDQGVQPALDRTQQAMQTAGAALAATAEREGRTAGQALGDGASTAARTSLDGVTDAARREGGEAGDALGDGVRDGARDGGEEGASLLEQGLSKAKTAALGIGAAAAGLLVSGFNQLLEEQQIAGKLGAQLGATPAQAQKYGEVAGHLWASAVTDDVEGAAEAVQATMSAGLVPPDATNQQIQSIATKMHDLSDTMGLDLGQAANAVGQIMKTNLAPNAQTAIDVLTRGMQVMGPRADDLGDTFNEYSTIFRQMGLSAGDATGIMAQGMQAGARDTDIVADSLKELTLITQGGGKTVDQAFSKIGLSGKSMQEAFTKGGPTAKKALDQIFDGLRNVKDPATRAKIAVTLFGTKAEDMQKALYKIDPSKATDALGKTAGSAKKMGDSLRDNATTKVEVFKRSLQQGVVDMLAKYVIPALTKLSDWATTHTGTLKVLAGVVGVTLVTAMTFMAISATQSAIASVAAWFVTGETAGASAARQVLAGARVVGTWILMGAQSLIQAARMAGAWLIAMGPVALIIVAVVALAALIYLNWNKIVGWTEALWGWVWNKIKAVGGYIVDFFMSWTLPGLIMKHWNSIKAGATTVWNAVTSFVKAIPGKLVSFFLNWTLPGLIIKHWNSIKSGSMKVANSLVSWVRGLPGRISSALGSLGSLLYSKGQDVVSGLWNGIKSMGGWLRSTLIGWAKNLIPGPIAKALGIASPSKVMAKDVGRWIPRGIVKGIESGSPALDKTMSNLVTPPSVGGSYSGGSMAAGGRSGGAGRITLEVRSSGRQVDEALVGVLRSSIGVRGGDVQTILGKAA